MKLQGMQAAVISTADKKSNTKLVVRRETKVPNPFKKITTRILRDGAFSEQRTPKMDNRLFLFFLLGALPHNSRKGCSYSRQDLTSLKSHEVKSGTRNISGRRRGNATGFVIDGFARVQSHIVAGFQTLGIQTATVINFALNANGNLLVREESFRDNFVGLDAAVNALSMFHAIVDHPLR